MPETYTVTTLEDEAAETTDLAAERDDGAGLSLREALAFANAAADGAEIDFDPDLADGTLLLTGGALVIGGDVAIRGDAAGEGSGDVTISGGGTNRVFEIVSGDVALSDLAVTGGAQFVEGSGPPASNEGGGGIEIAEGVTADLIRLHVHGNAANSYGGFGGGIFNAGVTTITDSLIEENTGGGGRDGGTGGGIENAGELHLDGVEISGNQSFGRIPGPGAGIRNTGTLTAVDLLIADNVGSYGAAIDNTGSFSAANVTIAGNFGSFFAGPGNTILNTGTLELVQTTIAANIGTGVDNQGVLTLVNSILAEDLTGSAELRGSNIVGGDLFDGATDVGDVSLADVFALEAGVPVLADNGGALRTIALRASGSNPAVDAGADALALDPSGAPLDWDARGSGFARQADWPARGNAVDLGAFEAEVQAAGLLVVGGEARTVESFGPRQDGGGFTIRDAGLTLTQDTNSWKQVQVDYLVTPDTVLAFDFASANAGEVHAIGFENDGIPDSGRFFQLLGSQSGFGLQDFNGLASEGGGRVHFEIPVGAFFTGSFENLVFATDDDALGGSQSIWSNLTLFERPSFAVNGTAIPVETYAPQDGGMSDVIDGASTLVQGTNAWDQLMLDYEVTENTVLLFDFEASEEGEIHAIGFETDSLPGTGETFFHLLGRQQGFGIRDFAGIARAGDGPVSFEIPVGEYFTGDFDRLVFATDDDAGSGSGSSWSNVRIVERGPLTVSGTAHDVESYGLPQDRGGFEVSRDGVTLMQEPNSWERVAIGYEVTAATMLAFDFASTDEGEIHAIGFDNDALAGTGDTYFQLLGTQSGFGIQDFAGIASADGATVRYEIPVGAFFTGSFESLVFVTDDDAEEGAQSSWSNIELYEA